MFNHKKDSYMLKTASIIAALVCLVIAAPARAEQCSVFENAKETIKKADTKQAIMAALVLIKPLTGDEVNAIVGSYPDADDLRLRALDEVDNTMRGCTKG